MQALDIKNLKIFIDNDCWERLHFYRCLHTKNYKASHQLLTEIKDYIDKYKIKEFEFVDFCNINLLELNKFCNSIDKNKLNIEWSAPAIINPQMDDEFINNMKKAGCKKLIFDLFSGSDALLEKMGISFTTAEALKLILLCHKRGIAVGINLVFGHPRETREDLDNTIDFLYKNLSLFDEITRITCCMSKYPFSDLPTCKHWTECSGLNKSDTVEIFTPLPESHSCKAVDEWLSGAGFRPTNGWNPEEKGATGVSPWDSTIDFPDCIIKVANLGKPIAYIEPSREIFDYFDKHVLRDKKLTFNFYEGKGHLFWESLRLTCGLGLYTSIFAKGFWQDSEHADWQITKINEREMLLKGKWQSLPVVQIWSIELKDESTINLKIEMELLEQTIIEGEQQVNIMLRDEYDKWSTDDGSKGFFHNRFDENWATLFEDDIRAVRKFKVETNALDDKLPCLSLSCSSVENGYRMSTLNSPSSFMTRILKCYKIGNATYPPGKYLYFEGEIKVNETV